jgi:amidase
MSFDLPYESLTTVSDLIRRRRLSSTELTDAILQRITKLDGQHGAYATVLPERALDRAKAADAEIARGLWRGPRYGVFPLAETLDHVGTAMQAACSPTGDPS